MNTKPSFSDLSIYPVRFNDMFYGTGDYDSLDKLLDEWENTLIACSDEYSRNLSEAIVSDTGDDSLYCVYMNFRNEIYFENRTCVNSNGYWWNTRKDYSSEKNVVNSFDVYEYYPVLRKVGDECDLDNDTLVGCIKLLHIEDGFLFVSVPCHMYDIEEVMYRIDDIIRDNSSRLRNYLSGEGRIMTDNSINKASCARIFYKDGFGSGWYDRESGLYGKFNLERASDEVLLLQLCSLLNNRDEIIRNNIQNFSNDKWPRAMRYVIGGGTIYCILSKNGVDMLRIGWRDNKHYNIYCKALCDEAKKIAWNGDRKFGRKFRNLSDSFDYAVESLEEHAVIIVGMLEQRGLVSRDEKERFVIHYNGSEYHLARNIGQTDLKNIEQLSSVVSGVVEENPDLKILSYRT